jgi:regulator of replication initiation timing
MTDLLANHRWPYPVISKIHASGDEPDRTRVLQALKEIRTNAASIKQSTFAPVGVGLIGLVCNAAEYLEETQNGWQDMEAPDPPGQGTQYEIAEEQRRYLEEQQQFRLCNDTDAALAQMLFAAADEVWWEELEKPLTGYGTRRAREFVEHMLKNYAQLDEETRKKTKMEMEQPWSSGPFEPVISRIQKGAATFAQSGNVMSAQSKCDTLYAIVHNSGRMHSACQKWRMKPSADKTWARCKTHFLQYARDMKHEGTAASHGYANLCTEMKAEVSEALSELRKEKQQFANMASDKENYNVENIRLKAELAATKAQLSVLQDLMQIQRPRPGKRTEDERKGYKSKPHYCWSHGYNNDHDSPDCTEKETGHENNATRKNPKGGKGHRRKRS